MSDLAGTRAMDPEDIEIIERAVDPRIMVHEPHGFIRLVDWMGDELTIVNAARVSFHKESEWEGLEPLEMADDTRELIDIPTRGYLSQADKGLVRYLLTKKHGTPFEHGFLAQFHIRVPIFVMREWVRHRVGFSINEESGRYVEMRGDFFIPEEVRERVGKPGHYEYKRHHNRGVEEWFKGELKMSSERAYDKYTEALAYGVAPEQARLFLPLNLYTEFRWTCNARSLMNFLALRNDPPAMEEIRDYAWHIEEIFKEKMPWIHQCFEEAGRVAP